MAGTTKLAARREHPSLDNPDHLVGTVTVTSGHNVTLNNDIALDLGASTVSGNLDVTAAGAITDSGNVTVTGTTKLTAGAANNITLDNSDDFGGVVTVISAKDVTLNDINSIDLAGMSIAGKLNVTAPTSIGLLGDIATVGGQTYNGPDLLKANINLTDSGSGGVTFNSTVDAATSGAQSLSINTAGATTFTSAVGGTGALASLTTDAGGTSSSVGVQTTGDDNLQ